MSSNEITPPVGTPAMNRRVTDHCPRLGVHEKKHYHLGRGWCAALARYFVMSAAIAVLILSYQAWQVLKHLDSWLAQITPAVQQQNTTMDQIHQAIHEEGAKSRAKKDDK